MRTARRLPSFKIVLLAISVSILLPLGNVSLVEWSEASTRLDRAVSVQAQAERLQILLQLSPALSQEDFSTYWDENAGASLLGLPADMDLAILPDLGRTAAEDRARVDEILDAVGDVGLTEAVASVRSDDGLTAMDIADRSQRFEQLAAMVDSTLVQELRQLSADAADLSAGELVHTVRIAETTASLQVVSSNLGTQWTKMVAAGLVSVSVTDVLNFSDSVSGVQHGIEDVQQVVPEAGSVSSAWDAVERTGAVGALQSDYQDLLAEFAAFGTESRTTLNDDINAGGTRSAALGQVASRLAIGSRLANTFNEGLAIVVATSLEEVDLAAADLVSDAQFDQRQVLVISAFFVVQVALAGLALVFTVGRPIARLANAAQRLSQGQLDTTLDEVGPREVRMGARALNEATASLRIVESQAMVLAGARFNDGIMSVKAPGALGKSLQTAVDRLAASLSERDNFQRKLEHDAAHDHLTELPNRAAILRQIEAALSRADRASQTVGLLFLDVDEFKEINDTYGHHIGDLVLQTIAQRLRSAIRTGDLAGRLGGDEFVVVAEPVKDFEAALSLSHRILEEVSKPVTFEGTTFLPSVSIGVGISTPSSNLTADELLRDADSAVYRAKHHGKGRVEVCDENLRTALKERGVLEGAIRRAIDDDELRLVFHPTVDAERHEIVGVEALVRWDRPGVGVVGPDGFIPAAERTDLILDIDRWVLCAAMSQLSEWSTHRTLRSISVAVNISGRHLGSGTLLQDVEAAIEQRNIDPTKLIIEVTETALLEDLERAARELEVLAEIGVRIALDDFGTGFMSLAHLRQLPVDILKIDRSFVAQIESHSGHSLVKLIIDTGHVLGVTITGEGVETEPQALILAGMGVDHLQGFYFCKPMAPSEVAEMATNSAALAVKH